jgi:hypothetical protein
MERPPTRELVVKERGAGENANADVRQRGARIFMVVLIAAI